MDEREEIKDNNGLKSVSEMLPLKNINRFIRRRFIRNEDSEFINYYFLVVVDHAKIS